MEPIVIGANSSIQDGVVIHSKSGAAMTIGENTPVAHRPIVHEPCKVGNGVFIGFNSVLSNCTVGEGAVERHSSVESFRFPSPCTVFRPNWMLVRPGRLTNGPSKRLAKVQVDYRPGMKVGSIPRRTVAEFIVTQAEAPTYLLQKPALSAGR